jgi:hypothetical protein
MSSAESSRSRTAASGCHDGRTGARAAGGGEELACSSVFRVPLWHGSDRELTSLRPDAPTARPGGRGEHGIYLSPRRRYARQYGSRLYGVVADVRRPLVVEGKHEVSPRDLTRNDVEQLKRAGYDAIVVVPKGRPLEEADEVVLFDADQVTIVSVE